MSPDVRPRIAIPVPTLAQVDYNSRAWPQYALAVEQAGGTPVQLSLSLKPADIMKLANSCQGTLLPGSPADVNPAKYGRSPESETAPPDDARENMDELLLQDAYNLHKPLLTICYGTQSLNTWRTGTLVQHLLPVPVNHRAGKSVAVAHSVLIDPASRLARLLADPAVPAQPLHLDVNSSHHQAVDTLGDGLRIAAACPQDGVVEAVEGDLPSHFVLGLQWHPERSIEVSAASRILFRKFVEACSHWHVRPALEPLSL
ncbi:MAG TPA: gamma-glutamyl-gamma-aminobutyrate hydrolase family protein [Acidobacteriaceae bacterium]|nr:gamma-glutamyl-gamma-aminobutyrate hydrolase family protein [Acidobacteriaceae bacterium]